MFQKEGAQLLLPGSWICSLRDLPSLKLIRTMVRSIFDINILIYSFFISSLNTEIPQYFKKFSTSRFLSFSSFFHPFLLHLLSLSLYPTTPPDLQESFSILPSLSCPFNGISVCIFPVTSTHLSVERREQLWMLTLLGQIYIVFALKILFHFNSLDDLDKYAQPSNFGAKTRLSSQRSL